MPYNLKQELSKPERFVGGHRLCAGCGAGIACRAITRALNPEDKAVILDVASDFKKMFGREYGFFEK